MVSRTNSEGLPYPLATEQADGPVDLAGLASAVDGLPTTWNTAWLGTSRPYSFSARSTASGGNIPVYSTSSRVVFDSLEFSSTTGLLSTSTGLFTQPASQAWSWWYFGGMIAVTTTAGSATAGTLIKVGLSVSWTNPLTNAVVNTRICGETGESASGGEYVGFHGLIAIYRGTASVAFAHADTGAGVTKAAAANSRFWGCWLGYV